jgi:hypothetical protein
MNRRSFLQAIGGVLASVGLARFVKAGPKPTVPTPTPDLRLGPDQVYLGMIHRHLSRVGVDFGKGSITWDEYLIFFEDDSDRPGEAKFSTGILRVPTDSHWGCGGALIANNTLLMVKRVKGEKYFHIHPR